MHFPAFLPIIATRMPTLLGWLAVMALARSVLAQPVVAQEAPSHALTLDAALAAARANNPTLHAAAAQAEAADARQDRARAALLPQLVGTAGYQRTTANFVPRPGQLPTGAAAATAQVRPLSGDTYNFFQLGVTASVLIYDFGGSIDRFRAAKETRHSFEERQRASELNVEFAVRDAFFRAWAQRALVQVAREALANNQRHVAQIQAFVDVGARPEIDLRQVRTEVANARVQLLQAENNHQIAKLNLQRTMGAQPTTAFEVADERLPVVEGEAAALDALLTQALRNRPDVVALERELRASALGESAAKGAYGPSLSASSGLTHAGVELGDLRWNWNGGVQLNWPIVRGGASMAEVREARANVRRAEAGISELRQTVRVQIEQARLGVGAASAVLEAAGEALDNARARLRLAEGRYEAGVGNIIELGDAQVALTQAEAQSVSAEYSLSLARAQLLSALGRSR